MDLGWGALLGASLAGWLARDLLTAQGRVESVGAPCTCVCKCAPESGDWKPLWIPLLILLILLLSFGAWLATRSIPVEHGPPRKGKGVYGQSSRTLQLTL